MEIIIQEVVTAGTERGGLDHSLLVTVTSKVEPHHAYVTAGFDTWFEAAWNALPESPDEPDHSGLWRDGMQLLGREDDYEQQLGLSKGAVRDLCRKAVVDGDWSLKLRSKEYVVSEETRVCGNAE